MLQRALCPEKQSMPSRSGKWAIWIEGKGPGMKKIPVFQHFLASEKLFMVQNQALINSWLTKDLQFFEDNADPLEILTGEFTWEKNGG